MKITLADKKAVRAGSALELEFEFVSGDNGQNLDTQRLVISVDDYIELGKPAEGEISEEKFYIIAEKSKIYEVKNTALYLLSFGENNRKTLIRKLVHKGYAKEYCELAAEELCRDGYIDEDEQIYRYMLHFANTKLYGARKIFAELLAKGYDRDDVRAVMREHECEIDYDKNKARLLEKKFGSRNPSPVSYPEKQKIREYLYRYGY